MQLECPQRVRIERTQITWIHVVELMIGLHVVNKVLYFICAKTTLVARFGMLWLRCTLFAPFNCTQRDISIDINILDSWTWLDLLIWKHFSSAAVIGAKIKWIQCASCLLYGFACLGLCRFCCQVYLFRNLKWHPREIRIKFKLGGGLGECGHYWN